MEHKQQLEVAQVLKLSPTLLQSMGILQMTTLELADYLQDLALENPVMEETPGARETAWDAFASRVPWLAGERMASGGPAVGEPGRRDREPESLAFFLAEQLDRQGLDQPLLAVCRYLVDLLDDHGRLDPEDLADLTQAGVPEALLEEGVDTIFYPCMSYNFDEHLSDNHYNCPVVAYYPDLLGVNIPALGQVNYLHPNLGLHRPKDFEKKGAQFLQEAFGIPKREAVKAIRKAYEAYDAFRDLVRRKGAEYIDWARANGHRILVVAGRPYHMDPEINHGINDLITGFGFVLVTEDAVFQHMDKQPRHVLNQWTYHARMYNAARYVCTQPDMAFLQLVSFGCGVDAITTDELRSILEEGGDLYTQIKIDDISNLGAVRIRIRSLMAALDARDAQAQKGGQ